MEEIKYCIECNLLGVFINDDTSFLSIPYIRFMVTTVDVQCTGYRTIGFWLSPVDEKKIRFLVTIG